MSDQETSHFTAPPSSAGSSGISDLLSDLVRDLTGLVRGEGRLVRTELAEAAKGMAAGMEQVAAGALLLLVALLVVVQAVVVALAYTIGPGWAAALVAAVLGLVGSLLVLRGRQNLSATTLIPERTLEQTSRDVRLAKEQL